MESMHDNDEEIKELIDLASDAFRESRIDQEQFAEIQRLLNSMQQDTHDELHDTLMEEPFEVEIEMPTGQAVTSIQRVSHLSRRFGLPRQAILRLEEDEIEILGLIIGEAGQYVTAREIADQMLGDGERWREFAHKVIGIKSKLNGWRWMHTTKFVDNDGVTTAYGVAA